MILTLEKFIPLFGIILIGYLLKRLKVLDAGLVNGLKLIIVDVALPSVFFVSFIRMDINPSDALFYIGTFLFCVILLLAGRGLQKARIIDYPVSGFFFSGFEFGMVGVALFGAIYGIDRLWAILLFGLGHELFIWFVYAPMLKHGDQGGFSLRGILPSLLRSPIIISITVALLLNLTGIYRAVEEFWVPRGIIQTGETIAAVVTPLILLVIGSGISLQGLNWKLAGRFIILRLLLIGIVGAAFLFLIDRFIRPVNPLLSAAAVTFLLLPPPFIIPVFMPDEGQEATGQYTATLVLYTLISLPLFLIAVLIIGPV